MLDRSELLAIDDDVDFVGEVIDDIWMMDWPEDSDSPAYVDFFRGLPHPKRLIWATWIVQGEIDNGGFGQYFRNVPDDDYISEALKGFTEFGAEEHRRILERVIAYRDSKIDQIARATDWDDYVKIMGVVPLDAALDGITHKFIAMNPMLYQLRRKYILNHLDVFAPT